MDEFDQIMTYKLVVGTFNDTLVDLELSDGSLKQTGSTSVKGCTFIDAHSDCIYLTAELDGQPGGIRKMKRTESGWETVWYTTASSQGTCHVATALHDGQRYILASNYVGHTVDLLSDDGVLPQTISYSGSGPFKGRQETSHCHSLTQDPKSGFIYMCDLGGDKVYQYKLATKLIETGVIQMQAGQGPRHVKFKDGKVLILCELSNELCTYTHDLTHVSTVSILPNPSLKTGTYPGFPQPASAAELQVCDDKIFASSRYLPRDEGDVMTIIGDEIIFHDLKYRSPWHFSIQHGFVVVAFTFSNKVVVYTTQMQEIASIDVKKPSCVLFI